MSETARRPKAATNDQIRMYFRTSRGLRHRFKAVASLAGETMEQRLERLMTEDVERSLRQPAAAV